MICDSPARTGCFICHALCRCRGSRDKSRDRVCPRFLPDHLNSQTQQAENKGWLEKHLLITRYDAARATRDETLAIEDILEILAVPLLGVIPESQEVLRASNVGSPITLSNNRSAPARAYVAAAEKLKGEAAVINNKSGLFTKWFGRKDHNAACENLSSTLVAESALNVERG